MGFTALQAFFAQPVTYLRMRVSGELKDKKPFTLPLGESAPDFRLPATDGREYSLQDFNQSQILVLFFSCNHCPFVTASAENTRQLADDFRDSGVRFVAINSNCEKTHPEDDFLSMQKLMEEKKYPWIYLRDKDQVAAQSYGALRTPHFYVFDQSRKLVYSGRSIDNPLRPQKAKVNDLELALRELLQGQAVSRPLSNPIGCNVKWNDRNAHWMPPESCDLV